MFLRPPDGAPCPAGARMCGGRKWMRPPRREQSPCRASADRRTRGPTDATAASGDDRRSDAPRVPPADNGRHDGEDRGRRRSLDRRPGLPRGLDVCAENPGSISSRTVLRSPPRISAGGLPSWPLRSRPCAFARVLPFLTWTREPVFRLEEEWYLYGARGGSGIGSARRRLRHSPRATSGAATDSCGGREGQPPFVRALGAASGCSLRVVEIGPRPRPTPRSGRIPRRLGHFPRQCSPR